MHFPAKCVLLLGLFVCLCLSPFAANSCRAMEQSPNAGSGSTYQLPAEQLDASDSGVPLDHPVMLSLIFNLPADADGNVIFFQKNQYFPTDEVVAWRAFPMAGSPGELYFQINPGLNLSVINAHGSSTSQQAVQPGQIYGYDEEYSGGYLYPIGPVASVSLLQVEKNRQSTNNGQSF